MKWTESELKIIEWKVENNIKMIVEDIHISFDKV